MPKKPSKNKFGAVIKKERYVTHKELAEALEALKASMVTQQSSLPQDAPRPRVFHKKKDGKREKLSTTIDANLFELVKQKQQAGQQLSHILDSALWTYFGHPKLSFE